MATYVLLTRLPSPLPDDALSKSAVSRLVETHVQSHCPDVKWLGSHALQSRDYIDVIDAPDLYTATCVSVLARSYGPSQTEVWPAMPWPKFRALMRSLPSPSP